jgi:hypothetical protein
MVTPNRIGRLVLRVDNVRSWRDLAFRMGVLALTGTYILALLAVVLLLAMGVVGEMQAREQRERAEAAAQDARLEAKLDGIRLEIEDLREQLGGEPGECAP